jgi:predicted transcriptional regulator
MSTTTVRLTKELKDKVVRAAERAGKTPHSFILEAIAEKAELEDRRAAFIETAEQRYARIVASGKAVTWSDMREYLERRISASRTVRPKPRRLAR